MAKKYYLTIPIHSIVQPENSGVVTIYDEKDINSLKFAFSQNEDVIFVPSDKGVVSKEFIGVKVKIEQVFSPFSGKIKVSYHSEKRVRITEVKQDPDGSYMCSCTIVKFTTNSEVVATGLFEKARKLYSEFVTKSARREIPFNYPTVNNDMDKIVATIDFDSKAEFFLNTVTEERLYMFIQAINKNLMIMSVDEVVSEKVKEAIDDNQKEYYVREQIKALYDEIGEDDDDDEYIEKIEKLNASDEIKEKLKRETRRLKRTAPASPEMALIKNYLDTVLELPWGVYTEDNDDLKEAEKVLNEDHYGLKKVKERLLEALAVRKLCKEGRSPIICLVGPPGIGKTSIAQSIARAMNKKYVRLSFGGVRDEAEIRGHRKTYIGAMPGRIITGIKTAGSMNPVFLMDEIDKMSSDYKGDPASALLEVLDPEQNKNFRDHFLEVSFDLSKVLFITTANTLDTISGPLLDRMEIIEMEGYTEIEKVEIAKRYLVKKAIQQNGVKPEWFEIEDGVIAEIINKYTKESGVRGLEKQINAIMRKVAIRFVDNQDAEKLVVSKQNLTEVLGEPKYSDNENDISDKVGVVTGLAWTSVGGDTLKIEVAYAKGKGDLILTGNLGDVMKESAKIAVSYIRTHADVYGIKDEFFKENDIHIHVPEGATPKDGPSAGITLCTAVCSALTGKEVRGDVAMTGEVSLLGNVLPIGGLKEKTLAALRDGIKTIFIPEKNKKDYKELPEEVKNKIEFIFVNNVKTVIDGAIKW